MDELFSNLIPPGDPAEPAAPAKRQTKAELEAEATDLRQQVADLQLLVAQQRSSARELKSLMDEAGELKSTLLEHQALLAQQRDQHQSVISDLANRRAAAIPGEPTVAPFERVVYYSKYRKHCLRFPFRAPHSAIVTGSNGPVLHTVRHPKAAAQFVPRGDLVDSGGQYTTSDPEEIAFLDQFTDPHSPYFHPHVKVASREEIAPCAL